MRRRRTKNQRAYRLTFGGTRKKLWASSMSAAVDEAKYWVGFGQKRVCIDRALPSGRFHRVRCITRK